MANPTTLGSPLPMRSVTLRNRVVGAPMERNLSDLAGRATQRYVDYLAARAAGGAGLLFTEASYVRQDSKARLHQAGMHDDSVLLGLAAVANAVHAHGALLGVEINHAGRVVPSAVSHRQPVGPSPIACAEIGGETPHELTPAEIDEVVAAYACAADRAVRGGADVVSVHGAHGYLIGQFLSPRSNARTDAYAQGTAFLDAVLVAVREAVGASVPVFLRWSAFEGLPGGLDRDASLAALLGARLDLVDVVDLSAGTYGAGHWITPSGEVDEGYLADLGRRYRSETGLVVSVAGRITTPAVARRLVDEGDVDLVSVARALHADPHWSRHALDGTAPRPCISCNQGCADVIFTGKPLWCSVNPRTGHEGELPLDRVLAADERAFLVVGGGPAGLQAALSLAEAGARVVLRETQPVLGGQLAMAAQMRSKPQFARLLEWYAAQLETHGVAIELGRATSSTDIDVDEFCGVVDATGGSDYLPSTQGVGAARVQGVRHWWGTQGHDDTDDSEVVIWGADRCGVYVADELLTRGRPVTLLCHGTDLAPDAGARERLPAVERLRGDPRATVVVDATLDEVLDEALVVTIAGTRLTLPSTGPVLASHGTVPTAIIGLVVDIPVVAAGEAAGLQTLDVVIASGADAARTLLARTAGARTLAVTRSVG